MTTTASPQNAPTTARAMTVTSEDEFELVKTFPSLDVEVTVRDEASVVARMPVVVAVVEAAEVGIELVDVPAVVVAEVGIELVDAPVVVVAEV
jgi:hypothetical protein